jgi:hypothetical protein
MIKLEVIDTPNNEDGLCTDHFLLSATEPMRVEVSMSKNGHLIAHVYKGTKVDPEQRPVGAYDSSISNDGWKT